MVASKDGHFVSCCYARTKEFAATILQHLVRAAKFGALSLADEDLVA
jgi:hypothetical protein